MELNLGYKYIQTNASKTFNELLNDHNLKDVTLVDVDNLQVRAHKIILISSSLFFKNIFLRHPHLSPLIYLKDIKYKYLDLIIKFIYTGQCDVEEPELIQFLKVGK